MTMQKNGSEKKMVGVISAGAFGTAIAQTLAHSGQDVLIWEKEADVVKSVNKSAENKRFMPGFKLSEAITATSNIEDLTEKCGTLFCCAPAAANTEIATLLAQSFTPEHTLVICSKGFRESDGALLSDVWQESIGTIRNLTVLSGPSFAPEMMEQKPTAVVVAGKERATVRQVSDLLSARFFRVYFSDDVIGLQVGGAVKNVLAIAAGLIDGLDLGDNCRAGVMSRGLVEMIRFGAAMGAKPQTLAGLSGLGDLILTATSSTSRNYRFGKKIAHGQTLDQAQKEEPHVIEGIKTARIISALAASHGIDLGIINAVDGILHGDLPPERAIEYLLMRPRVDEFDSHLFDEKTYKNSA